jgi:hypothetical protein
MVYSPPVRLNENEGIFRLQVLRCFIRVSVRNLALFLLVGLALRLPAEVDKTISNSPFR